MRSLTDKCDKLKFVLTQLPKKKKKKKMTKPEGLKFPAVTS